MNRDPLVPYDGVTSATLKRAYVRSVFSDCDQFEDADIDLWLRRQRSIIALSDDDLYRWNWPREIYADKNCYRSSGKFCPAAECCHNDCGGAREVESCPDCCRVAEGRERRHCQ